MKIVSILSQKGGAGKTTLAASYLEEAGVPAIWHQIDPGDSDPATFFYYLKQAIEAAGLCEPRRPLCECQQLLLVFVGLLELRIDNLQRVQVGNMLRDWEKKFPGRLNMMFNSLKDIKPSHMLDRKLYDFEGLSATGVASEDGDKAFDPENFAPPATQSIQFV